MTCDIWTDWSKFVEHVAIQIRDGATTETLTEVFGGRTVQWNGKVNNVDLDEMAPGIELEMPKQIVDLESGRQAILHGLGLPISHDSIAQWRPVNKGDRVEFVATFVTGTGPFPALEIKCLSSGTIVLMIRLNDGRLIDRLRR